MAKRSLSQQLDERVEAVLIQGGARPESGTEPTPSAADLRLAPLGRIAADLRGLPRPEFKVRLKSELERRALMATTAKAVPTVSKVKPIPEGYHSVAPYLMVRDAARAMEFYKQAFGATEVMRLRMPNGKIGHAEIQIGDSRIMLSDEFPEYGNRSPEAFGGSPVIISLFVEDVDALASKAVANGAKILRPVSDQFHGDRSGRLMDPFGHVWIVSTHIEDVSPEEIERRAEAFMKEQVVSAGEKQAPTQPAKAASGVREGFHTVTPYITAHEAPELLDFVKQAFGAEELLRTTGSAGGMHAEVRIGDSMMMIGGGGAWRGTPTPTALHLYVPDTDATYQRALQFGATSMHEPMDQPYGERSASVKDGAGNQWYIATYFGPQYIPVGLRAVNAYLHPRSAAEVIDFMKQALGGEEVARYTSPEGAIQHAQVRIGDSVIEMGEAHGPYQPMPTTFYLYVDDCDALYKRAIQAGATSINEPADQPYGDRNAGIKDPFDNVWYIATHIQQVS
jgi:PhnB protein